MSIVQASQQKRARHKILFTRQASFRPVREFFHKCVGNGKAGMVAHACRTSDGKDSSSIFQELNKLRNSFFSGYCSDLTSVFLGNAFRIRLRKAPKTAASTTACPRDSAIDEYEHIVGFVEVAFVELRRIDHFERKLKLFENPTHPA